MKKRIATMLLAVTVVCLVLAGCGGESAQAASSSAPPPLDLTGSWEEKDAGDSYQAGYIKDGEIVLYWVSDGGDIKALYWAGTYVAPATAADSYTWDSVNDKEQTSTALLASGDDTKTFTYENGELTYEMSALGVTSKMHLVRTDTDYSK